MSTYSRISKEIGWDKQTISIPQVATSLLLISQAERGDEIAFKRIFEVIRFGEIHTAKDIECINVLMDAFDRLRKIYEDIG